jgi:LPXTG-site transpeptidase (sortase) family protein
MTRRALSVVLTAAGVVLIGVAVLHYARGARAQREGSEVLRKQFASGYTPSAMAKADRDDLPRGSVLSVSAGYPFGQPIARIRIPSARMDWVVFAGTDDATLEKGPGHVPGTALPGQEGPPENCVITAHRDSHFRNLGWLRKGHTIELETAMGTKKYRVVSREIVTPKAVRVLAATPAPRLTLITCYPFTYIGSAPQRLVVVAEPIGAKTQASRAHPGTHH